MKNFKLKVEWIEKLSGEVNIRANTLEEALEKLKEKENSYLIHSDDRHVSSIGIEKTTLLETNNDNIIDVDFTSEWEYSGDLTTNAKYNATTGVILEVEQATDFECQVTENSFLLGECISFDNEKLAVIEASNTITHGTSLVTTTFIEANLIQALKLKKCEIELIYDEDEGYAFINCDYGNSAENFDDIVYNINSEFAWRQLKDLFERYDRPIYGCYC